MIATTDVPLIDFSRFADAAPAERASIARRIREVSSEIGFVYLGGTAIDASLTERLLATARTFFAADAAKRTLTTPHTLDDRLRAGFTPQGHEHEDPSTPSDIKEALDLFLVDGYNEDAYVAAIDAPLPAEIAAPIADFVAYHALCTRVADDILRAFAIGFGFDEDYFVVRHGGNNMLRVLHYPPVVGPTASTQMRVGAHTDFGTLTLLIQDPSGGLDVLAADGRWVNAPAIPGAVLVNIGDLMQTWTNGEFRSTHHRVAVPSDDRAAVARYSIAFFCEPNNDTEIAGTLAGDHLRARLRQSLIPKA
jgi:isopenicillin N synthase-like dioxygenase